MKQICRIVSWHIDQSMSGREKVELHFEYIENEVHRGVCQRLLTIMQVTVRNPSRFQMNVQKFRTDFEL